jgi:hypothetical protein
MVLVFVDGREMWGVQYVVGRWAAGGQVCAMNVKTKLNFRNGVGLHVVYNGVSVVVGCISIGQIRV